MLSEGFQFFCIMYFSKDTRIIILQLFQDSLSREKKELYGSSTVPGAVVFLHPGNSAINQSVKDGCKPLQTN